MGPHGHGRARLWRGPSSASSSRPSHSSRHQAHKLLARVPSRATAERPAEPRGGLGCDPRTGPPSIFPAWTQRTFPRLWGFEHLHQQPPKLRLCVSVPSRPLGQWGHGSLASRGGGAGTRHGPFPVPPAASALGLHSLGCVAPPELTSGQSHGPSVLGAGSLGHRLPGKWGIVPGGLHPAAPSSPVEGSERPAPGPTAEAVAPWSGPGAFARLPGDSRAQTR